MNNSEEKDTSLDLSTSDMNPLEGIEPKIQRFIHLYLTGQHSLSKLAQLLDVHPNTVHNWMRREDVRGAISVMQSATTEIVADQMQAMTMKALDRMRELMDSPIDGVALQAVKDILDRTGHKPKQQVEKNVNVRTFEEKLDDLIDDVIEGEWEDVE